MEHFYFTFIFLDLFIFCSYSFCLVIIPRLRCLLAPGIRCFLEGPCPGSKRTVMKPLGIPSLTRWMGMLRVSGETPRAHRRHTPTPKQNSTLVTSERKGLRKPDTHPTLRSLSAKKMARILGCGCAPTRTPYFRPKYTHTHNDEGGGVGTEGVVETRNQPQATTPSVPKIWTFLER